MPQPKKTSRPRLDAVIRHIRAGSYDEDMSQLKGAIEDRYRVRQEAVLGQVREVFGSDYTVVPPAGSSPAPASRQRPGGPIRAEGEVLPGESPHVQQPVGDEDDELGPDHVSQSAIFGSIDSSTSEVTDADPPAAP